MGNSTWNELKRFFEVLGVEQTAWPEFPNHQCSIDVPIHEVVAKNATLKAALHQNSKSIAKADLPERYRKILDFVARGELIFFTPV